MLIAIGAKFVETSTFFLFATFTISYLVGLGYPRVQALNVVLVAALIAVPVMLYFGALSDRGRKKVFAWGTVAIAIYALPYFWLLNQGSALIATAAVVLGFPSSGPPTAPCWARSSPSFPPRRALYRRFARLSGGRGALVGEPMPLIATALLARYDGSYVPVAVFIVFAPRCR